MVMCFACRHYSEKQECTFFTFPKDPNELAKWLKHIRRIDRLPGKYSRICSCHFVNRDKTNGPTLFGFDAVPRFSVADFKGIIKQKMQNIINGSGGLDSEPSRLTAYLPKPSVPSRRQDGSIPQCQGPVKDTLLQSEELQTKRKPPQKNYANKRKKVEDVEPSLTDLQKAYNIMKMVCSNIKPSDEFSSFGDMVGHKIRNLKSTELRNLAQVQINKILYELCSSCDNVSENDQSATSSNSEETVATSEAPTVEVRIKVEDSA